MKKKWLVKQSNNIGVNLPEYPGMVSKLLALRGITDQQQIHDYLNPDYSKLIDPFIFKDMDKSCQRIWGAIDKKEKIVIYADYDADAITASSVLTLGLRKLGATVDCYIPDRFTEGYGMNLEAIQKVKQDGANLMITVDCGTNSVAEAKLCREIGLDLIISDHHEITGQLPEAYTLINPKNPEDLYPFKYLTGVGVAFKIIQALFSNSARTSAAGVIPGWEKWLLDLVAIGTVADLQSLTSENRIMVYYGLQVLNKTRWPGLRALLDTAKFKPGKFTTHTLGFVVAPRINAAGRIKHADVAYKMLISDNIIEAQNYAMELEGLNLHRQQLTEQILSEAREQILLVSDKKVLLASGANWPKGVVGLVAGKLAEEFGKPVLIMDRGELQATGSARSHPNFDIVKALTYSKDLLEKYGGHTQAAGFTLRSDKIESLYMKLLEFAETFAPDDSGPVLEIDAEMSSTDLNWETYELIEKFEPFGIGNPRPKFLGKSLQLVDCRTVGADSQHLKLRALWNGKVAEAIAFKQGYLTAKLKPGSSFDAVFEVEANEWNGHKDLQLKIIDINILE
ncbi:MAG: single-stranded-DNA-specific exonuclease RecJ [Candidatus Doudnabacteria bacterium]|nr:single-stranded-DNA-specific exonuclease RecJ [Candidatus Doudnabacteria bacterium]